MAKVATIKNISRGNFLLTLEQVTDGKVFELKPNSEIPVNEDELAYLMNDCQGAFKKGYLEVIKANEEIKEHVDIIETENKMSDEEIEKMLNSNLATLKKKLSTIDASHLLKEIRIKAEDMNKSSKVIEAIDERIKSVADSLVL